MFAALDRVIVGCAKGAIAAYEGLAQLFGYVAFLGVIAGAAGVVYLVVR